MLKKRSIFTKILILTISVSFLLGISVFLVAIREQNQNLEEALIGESKLFAQGLAEDIEAGYLLQTLPSQPSVESKFFKEFLFLWVVQPNGKIYFADKPEMLGKVVKDPSLGTSTIMVKDSIFPETGEKIKLVVYPLKIEIEEKPWNLFIGVSLESLTAARKKLFITGFALFAGAFIFLILLSFYLAKKVTNPIKELKKGVRIIGKGNLDYQIKLKTGDEIEDLGNAFNQMAEDLKEHYLALRKEELKTLTVFTSFSDGLLVFDEKDNLSLVNPRFKDFFGEEAEKLTGSSIAEISRIPVFQRLATIYKKRGKEIFRKELKIGENLFLEITTIPLMAEKKRLGTLVILHDVTREKLIDRTKTEFVSLTAHQLRTPLSAIKWITKMVLDEELGKINKEQREFLEDSYKSNERMITLINDLLNVARIEEGRYVFKPILANIEEITKDVVDSYKKETKRGGLKIDFKKPEKRLPQVMVDVEKIGIAIDNLVKNAIGYTLRGGRVIVSLKCAKKEIEFSIKDNGVGIPKQQQKRIFTKFFRGANVIKIETVGTGLGLYITKNIIEAHGGKIWFESGLGKGTTFYFTIPIKK